MKTVPFSILQRKKIETDQYKVVTRDGRPVRIICWDRCDDEPVVALIKGDTNDKTDPRERIVTYFSDGNYLLNEESPLDLLIIKSEA